MLGDSQFPEQSSLAKIIIPIVAAVAIAGGGAVYAIHEHNSVQNLEAQKQALAAQNQQVTAQLAATHSQVDALAAKVNSLAASSDTSSASGATAGTAAKPHAVTRRASVTDSRYRKLQSQLDTQGKQIDAQGKAIDDARNDLANTRTELSGSIAKTHDELVVLEKRGERNYFEFDLGKSKQFKREGPIGISLRKANTKRGYADLMMMVDDRNLQQKHVNLYQPSMFYEPDSQQPIEIVINDISKDHIHGYVSAPKYRKSELAAMSNANGNNGSTQEQAANSGQGDNDIVGQAPSSSSEQSTNAPVAPRKRLPLPGSAPNNQ